MLADGQSVSEVAGHTERTLTKFFIGDLSRCDVQAYFLRMQVSPQEGYHLRWGLTYLTAYYPVIPRWIWPDNTFDSGKVVAGTDALYGENSYRPFSPMRSSAAYGLAGETMLNFGWPAVPVVYALLGWIVGRFRKYVVQLPPGDLRALLVPYGVLFMPNMLLWDSDNYLAHWLARAGFVFATVFLMSSRRERSSVDRA
jgi:hypothetical protein